MAIEVNMKIFLILFIIAIKSSTSSSYNASDSTQKKNVVSSDWIIYWDQESAIAINVFNYSVDTIFYDYYEDNNGITFGDKFMDTVDYISADTLDDWGYFRINYTMLSIVGPYVSFLISYDGTGAVHDVAGNYYDNYNLKSGSHAEITDIFPASDIYLALLHDSIIISDLKGYNPKDINDLIDHLDGDCQIDFSSLLTNFAVKYIDNMKAVIEFGLPHGCEVMKGNFTYIDISLMIPKDKMEMFIQAKQDGTILDKMIYNDFYKNLKWY